MERSVSFEPDAGSAAMAQAQTRTQFVGRDRELDELLAALNDTRAGRGRAVLIGGEPGIGKSRLADELTVRAQSSNWLPLWGRAWEDAGAPPYWPWVQALRTLVRTLDRDEIVRCVGSGGADIAQMLPELREHLPDLPPPTSADSETARFQLFDSTTSLLRRVATERPLLIILDDLHAADTPSILFLRFLATQLADMGLLVVGTYRDLELTPEHPLTLAISEMARQSATRLMMLGGLTSDAVSDYIRSAAEIEPDGLAVAAVWRETNGNPLFVGEAVRLLQAEGKLTEVGDLTSLRFAVPSGVRAVISRRIGHLADDTSAALRVGAVIGPEFALDVLRRVLDVNSARAAAAMDEAVQAGLPVPVSTGVVRFRFSHDLVRETLYDAVPLYERAEMHRRIAETLEAIHGATSAQHLAELAFHYNQAAQLGADDQVSTRDKAIVYARRAGDQAARALAYEEASQLYAMALAALAAGDTEDPRERTELLLALGDADARTGDLDRARGSFVEASRLAREIGSGELLARAALGYGGRHQMGRAGKKTLLVPLLRDAMTSLGAGDERLRVRVQTRLAGAMRSDPTQRDECDRLSAEAVALARDLDDADTLGFALAGRFWATWWPENPEERQRLLDEIEKIAAAIGDGEWISQAALLRFMFLFESGRIDEASGQVDRLIEVVRRTRQPAQLWLEPVSRAELALFRGDFELAEELIAEQFKTAYRVNPSKDDRSAAMMHRFLIRREQGRLAEIEVDVRAAGVEFSWYPCHKAALSIALLELDRADEARFV